MLRRALLISIALGATLNAQAPAPTSYELNISGASSSVYSFVAATVQCNLVSAPGSGTVLNPRYLVWDDNDNPGRFCVHDTGQGTGPLFALPIGDYSANLVAVTSTQAATLKSDPSNTANFSRLTQPAVRTGFHVRGVL